jgi:hypothetical protein
VRATYTSTWPSSRSYLCTRAKLFVHCTDAIQSPTDTALLTRVSQRKEPPQCNRWPDSRLLHALHDSQLANSPRCEMGGPPPAHHCWTLGCSSGAWPSCVCQAEPWGVSTWGLLLGLKYFNPSNKPLGETPMAWPGARNTVTPLKSTPASSSGETHECARRHPQQSWSSLHFHGVWVRLHADGVQSNVDNDLDATATSRQA